MIDLKITKDDAGKRLDVFLQEKLSDFTRSHIKNMIEEKLVFVNGKNCKAGEKLKENYIVSYDVKEPELISNEPEDIDFEIVYEDSDLLVINKPQGLVVHPCTSKKSGTLVNGLLYKIKDLSGINGKLRPGIVHRLDKDTSGLMLVAKNDFSHVSLAEQIKEKTCKRCYLALLEGNLSENEGKIQTFLNRNPKDRKKMAVCESGKEAITFYKVLQRYERNCLVEFSLKTGRTHQIRVHSSYLGHSVVGDEVYGKKDKNLNGQLLHSYKIEFYHPRTKNLLKFEIDLPKYFSEYLKKLKVIEC